MPLRTIVAFTASTESPSPLYGLVREVPRIVPPRCRIPRVDATDNDMVWSSTRPLQPCRIPMNSWPYSRSPRRTSARITAFRPGQSPPPVSTPILMAAFLPASRNVHVACL